MFKFRGLFFAICSLFLASATNAQFSVDPGEQVKTFILESITEGTTEGTDNNTILQQVVIALVRGEIEGLSEEATAYLETNQDILKQLLALVDANTTGFDLAAAGMALFPDNAENVAIIAMILFPSNGQEVYNLALQSGTFTSSQDAQVMLIAAGVDVSELSETAAGADGLTAVNLPTATDDTTPGAGGNTVSGN